MGLRKLECSTCGAVLAPEGRGETVTCRYCGSTFGVPTRAPRSAAYPAPQVRYSKAALAWVIVSVAMVLMVGAGATIFQIVSRTGPDGSEGRRAGIAPLPVGVTAPAGTGAGAGGGGQAPSLSAKLDLVAQRCFNDLGPDVLQSRYRYLDWADAEEGPRRRGRNVYGLYEVDDASDCRAGLAEAQAVTPARPSLEGAARTYADAAQRVHEVVSEAYLYYERENYLDDDFRKGQELHAPMMQAFAAFEDAHRALERELDAAFEEVVGRQADRLGRNEDDTGMLVLHSQLAARQIAEMSNVEWREVPSIDLEAYQTLVEGYEALIDRMTSAGLAEEDYLEASAELALAAKEVLRRRRDGQGWSTGDRMILRGRSAHWMVDGSPGKVVDKYNDLLRESPSPALRWVAPTEYLRSDG